MKENKLPIVVVGAGHAGVQVCEVLRNEGCEDDIILISREVSYPYMKPPLSKKYMNTGFSEDQSLIRPPLFYDKKRISLILKTAVISLDTKKQEIKLSDGRTQKYSFLVLATGTTVRKLSMDIDPSACAYSLFDLEGAEKIKDKKSEYHSCLVIGGGFIGLELAASLRTAGLDITLLVASERILSRTTAKETAAFITQVHSRHGVNIITGVSVSRIEKPEESDKPVTVHCHNGATYQADFVIAGIGVVPEFSLAQKAGLETDGGVVVDSQCKTSNPHIFSVGDCTVFFCNGKKMHLESIQNATDQATVAARNIMGNVCYYEAVPWFWSDQYDLKLQIAGLNTGYDHVQVLHREEKKSFVAAYFREEELISVDAINCSKAYMRTKRLLQNREKWTEKEILNGDKKII